MKKKKETIIITDNLSPSSFYRLNQKFYSIKQKCLTNYNYSNKIFIIIINPSFFSTPFSNIKIRKAFEFFKNPFFLSIYFKRETIAKKFP